MTAPPAIRHALRGVDDPLAGYHVGWQDEPQEQDPLEGYTPDWGKKRRTPTAAVTPPPRPTAAGTGG